MLEIQLTGSLTEQENALISALSIGVIRGAGSFLSIGGQGGAAVSVGGRSLFINDSGSDFLRGTIDEIGLVLVQLPENPSESISFLDVLSISGFSFSAAGLYDVLERTDTTVSARFNQDYLVDQFQGENLLVNGDDEANIVAPTQLFSFDGDDTINGLGGNDFLDARDGDDWLEGGNGNDTLIGGAGEDTVAFLVSTDEITANDLGGGQIEIVSPEGIDVVESAEFFDFIDGTFSLAELLSLFGPPSVPGIVVQGSPQSNVLIGTAGDDTITGRAGNDTVDGGAGNDSIDGGIGFDNLEGGNGNDTIFGLNGFDVLSGGVGNDSLNGGFGNDTLDGGSGDDTLSAGQGADSLSGGQGNDILRGLNGFDTLAGGAGDDDLQGNSGNDMLSGGDDADTLQGGQGADTLDGGAGNDSLLGSNGFDQLAGGAGNDDLQGNAGRDTLDGGIGDDTLRGGQGADSFVFTDGADLIRDFSNNVDTLMIEAALLDEAVPVGSDLANYASVVNGAVVLDFGNGDSLTLNGITNAAALFDDVVFV